MDYKIEGACAPIEVLVLGPLSNNVYFIGSDDALIVVDPTCCPERILEEVGDRKVAAIVLTHDHWDHVGAAKALREATGAPVIASALDAPGIEGKGESHSTGDFEPCQVDRIVVDGDMVEAGSMKWQVIETPGHTPGSICLFFDPNAGSVAKSAVSEEKLGAPILVSGDTLFQGTHGRTDFKGGSPDAMKDSLKRLAHLPEETIVLPGHNNPTTIKAEKVWIG